MTQDFPIPIVLESTATRYDNSYVGGKAAGLLRFVADRNEDVPPFFVVTTRGFDLHLAQTVDSPAQVILRRLNEMSDEEFEKREFATRREDIVRFVEDQPNIDRAMTIRAFVDEMLDNVETSLPYILNPASAAVRLLIEAAELPTDVSMAILEHCHKLGLHTVMDRSSGTAEDQKGDSSAGMQESIPAQGDANILTAYKRCISSLFTFRAWEHRDGAYDQKKVKMAIVIQDLILAEASAVVMTVKMNDSNPDFCTVSGAHGTGEYVVQGLGPVSTWEVRKSDWTISRKVIKPQHRMMVNRVGQYGKMETIWEEVPAHLVNHAPFTDEEVISLAREYEGVAQKRGYQVDCEVAKANGRTRPVQERPVTEDFIPFEEGGVETAEVLLTGESASPHAYFGVVRRLAGAHEAHLLQRGEILVAPFTSPDFGPALNLAQGIVTEEGGPGSHGCVIARTRKKAGVVGVENAMEILQDGMEVTVDGRGGKIYLGRAEKVLAAYERWKAAESAKTAAQMASGIKTETKLKGIAATYEEAVDLIQNYHVDGIGLLRMEHALEGMPHAMYAIETGRAKWYVDELTSRLEPIVRLFPVGDFDESKEFALTMRAPDLRDFEFADQEGGEKYRCVTPGPTSGPNLDMHVRGLRHYIQFPEATRLYAQVAKNLIGIRPINFMMPFCDTVSNTVKVRRMLASYGLRRDGTWKFFVMWELPSTILNADALIREAAVEGGSIGQNDLDMFLRGLDRNAKEMTKWASDLDPSLVKASHMAIEASNNHGIPCGSCGNAPSVHSQLGRIYVRAGITSISVFPDMQPTMRGIIIDEEAAMRADGVSPMLTAAR